MIDFLNSTPCVCPLSPCTLHPAETREIRCTCAQSTCELHAGFEGLRCDYLDGKVQCPAIVAGRTDTREKLRRLTLRAEALGWQTRFVDGKAMHWCSDHASVDRERLTRFDAAGRRVK